MLTNNWKNLMRAFMATETSLQVSTLGIVCKDVSGVDRGISNSGTNSSSTAFTNLKALFCFTTTSVSASTSTDDAGIVFGDGTAAPSVADVWLSGNKITTIQATGAASVISNDNGSVTKSVVYTITNTSTSVPVTIAEIGYVGRINPAGGSAYSILLDRTLLEEPVTIPPGGVGQITYTIPFNVSINKE